MPSHDPSPIEPSLTIAEFRAVEQLSHSAYYAMRNRGEGPDEIRTGGIVRIAPEAHRRWRERHTVIAAPQQAVSRPSRSPGRPRKASPIASEPHTAP